MNSGTRQVDRPIRLLLVDGNPRVRRGLRLLFSTCPDFEVVGEAGRAADAVAEVARLDPDVVLMDLRLAEQLSRFPAALEDKRRRGAPRLVLLTMSADLEAHTDAAGAGPLAIKGCAGETLLEALRQMDRIR